MADLRAQTGTDPRPSGVDASLLEAMRRLTPEERLRWNDRAAGAILELRDAFAARALADEAPDEPRGERD